jgi:hypothetical protein
MESNNAHLALHGTLAALAFCLVVAVFFHVAPYHEVPAATITAPPADCLPSGTDAPCLSFDKIQQMMEAQPDAPEPIPANPAASHEEKI